MRVLVLGGYGLIGTAICKELQRGGHDVKGLGRSAKKGQALLPSVNWLQADIAALLTRQDWFEYLDDVDVVVNASGALQNGLKDNLAAVQRDAIIALIKACEVKNIEHFVQISAPGVDERASTLFYRTKAAADMALKSSQVPWTIFRPGLVISPYAYGGTSLIRMLAATPYVQPIMMGDSAVQTVCIDDVAKAVSIAISSATSEKMKGQDINLVEDEPQNLLDVTLQFRQWLGFGRPKMIWNVPNIFGRWTARFADILGWLGWRSALQTTSLNVLTDGVQGSPKTWVSLGQGSLKPLSQTLFDLPSTKQERLYARTMLAFPLLLGVLSAFWIVSGVIGFWQQDLAINIVRDILGEPLAKVFIWAGSVMDIIIGCALLFRPTARLACLAAILLSLGYLSASAWATPHLWSDPLGPMVKVLPSIALALIVAALLEER